jgi:uncharacterized DUF497 family protein
LGFSTTVSVVRYFDPDHSGEEDRLLLAGMSQKRRIPIESHCFKQGDSLIRIISARKATKSEEENYWSGEWSREKNRTWAK